MNTENPFDFVIGYTIGIVVFWSWAYSPLGQNSFERFNQWLDELDEKFK